MFTADRPTVGQTKRVHNEFFLSALTTNNTFFDHSLNVQKKHKHTNYTVVVSETRWTHDLFFRFIKHFLFWNFWSEFDPNFCSVQFLLVFLFGTLFWINYWRYFQNWGKDETQKERLFNPVSHWAFFFFLIFLILQHFLVCNFCVISIYFLSIFHHSIYFAITGIFLIFSLVLECKKRWNLVSSLVFLYFGGWVMV